MKKCIDTERLRTFREKQTDVQNVINAALWILNCFGIPLNATPRRLERMAMAFLATGDIKRI
jgi:type II restriction enzyme